MASYRKKIEVHELRRGMFVEALDRPWLDTPYLLEGIAIESEDDIEQLGALCEFVYISSDEPPLDDQPGDSAGSSVIPPVGEQTPRSFHEELPAARKIHENASGLVKTIHDGILDNQRPDTTAVGEVVDQMMDSVARHPDALVWFSNLKTRDEYTAIHSLNVCMLAVTLATFVCNDTRAIKDMGIGALLHDVGKIKIPLEVLNKPGRLTEAEFALMKKHPEYGVEILKNSANMTPDSLEVVRDHHERLNGSGYPAGLRGSEISYYSQIAAIADVYDAMTSDRIYKKGRAPSDALKLMISVEGDFNDELLRQFADYLGDYPVGTLVELNTGEVGFVIPTGERREKPTVLLVLDFKKRRYFPQRVRDLMRFPKFVVNRMLAPGTYGVDVDDYAQNLQM
jgi:HD-GYP domain-containing protein (c-di-GMP phosphodiesterase class II)